MPLFINPSPNYLFYYPGLSWSSPHAIYSLSVSECQLPTPANEPCPCPSFICCILKYFLLCYTSCLGALHKHPPSNPFAARPKKDPTAVRLVVLATLLITLTSCFLPLPHLSISICCRFSVLTQNLLYPSPDFCSNFVQHLAQLGHGSRQWFVVIQIRWAEDSFFMPMRRSLSFISYIVYEIISILFSDYRTHMLTFPVVESRLKLLSLNPTLCLGKPSYLLNF